MTPDNAPEPRHVFAPSVDSDIGVTSHDLKVI